MKSICLIAIVALLGALLLEDIRWHRHQQQGQDQADERTRAAGQVLDAADDLGKFNLRCLQIGDTYTKYAGVVESAKDSSDSKQRDAYQKWMTAYAKLNALRRRDDLVQQLETNWLAVEKVQSDAGNALMDCYGSVVH